MGFTEHYTFQSFFKNVLSHRCRWGLARDHFLACRVEFRRLRPLPLQNEWIESFLSSCCIKRVAIVRP